MTPYDLNASPLLAPYDSANGSVRLRCWLRTTPLMAPYDSAAGSVRLR